MSTSSLLLPVKDISGDDRRSLEHLLGKPIHDDQSVHIRVYSVGPVPDATTWQAALARMTETSTQVRRHMEEHNVSEADMEAAIDEACEHVRYATR